ncbi:hypothetical protein EJB05_54131, partial [Eragrostis curvula]
MDSWHGSWLRRRSNSASLSHQNSAVVADPTQLLSHQNSAVFPIQPRSLRSPPFFFFPILRFVGEPI